MDLAVMCTLTVLFATEVLDGRTTILLMVLWFATKVFI